MYRDYRRDIYGPTNRRNVPCGSPQPMQQPMQQPMVSPQPMVGSPMVGAPMGGPMHPAHHHHHEHEKCCGDKPACKKLVSQYADISLPVSIMPYAIMGEACTECCGEPVVSLTQRGCGHGCKCELVVTQKLKVKIPIVYGADTEKEGCHVRCHNECDHYGY